MTNQDISIQNISDVLSGSYQHDLKNNLWLRHDGASIEYSDGKDVEDYLYNTVLKAKDRSVFSEELRESVQDWPSYYYFSPIRTNLLRPIADMLKGSGLEAGCGCGALTRFIADQCDNLVALEGSKKRAQIAALRCEGLNNVNVVVDNLMDFKLKGFDWISLIGVLEYAACFVKTKNPVNTVLTHLRSLLKEDGLLIIAIENQLGLKYFAGANEDHLGVPYVGISNAYKDNNVRTFGRQRLISELKSAGFENLSFYYPFPDYKQPKVIVSDEVQSYPEINLSAILSSLSRPNFDITERAYAENAVWQVLSENNNWREFSNSFLIVAGNKEHKLKDKILVSNYSTVRGRKGAVVTEIKDSAEGLVVKRKLMLGEIFKSALLNQNIQDEKYISGKLYTEKLFNIVNRSNWTLQEVIDWAKPWKDLLVSVSTDGGHTLPCEYIDCIPNNIIVSADGSLHPFDLEWQYNNPLPSDWVLFRGLLLSLLALDGVSDGEGTNFTIGQIIMKVMSGVGEDINEERFGQLCDLEIKFYQEIFGYHGEVYDKIDRHLKIFRSLAFYKETEHELSNIKHELSNIKHEYYSYCQEVDAWRQQMEPILHGKAWKVFRFLRRCRLMLVDRQAGGRIGFLRWLCGRNSKYEENNFQDPMGGFPKHK